MKNNEINMGHIDFKKGTLSGFPHFFDDDFMYGHTLLISLVGGPQIVTGDYHCYDNNLTDLVGCASHIGGDLYVQHNPITSLVGIHKIIKSCKGFYFDDDKIKEGGIGLLLIKDLTEISDTNIPFQIIQGYVGTGTKGMMECRKELIEQGYHAYAKL